MILEESNKNCYLNSNNSSFKKKSILIQQIRDLKSPNESLNESPNEPLNESLNEAVFIIITTNPPKFVIHNSSLISG